MSHGGLGKFPNRVLATCPGSSAGRMDDGEYEAPELIPLFAMLPGKMDANLAGGAYSEHSYTDGDNSHQGCKLQTSLHYSNSSNLATAGQY